MFYAIAVSIKSSQLRTYFSTMLKHNLKTVNKKLYKIKPNPVKKKMKRIQANSSQFKQVPYM